MNKNEIRKEIAALIDSIKQHSDEIGHHKRIPQIELELILSKIKRLYEKSIVFNYLNTLEEAGEESQEVSVPPYINPVEPAPVPDLKDAVQIAEPDHTAVKPVVMPGMVSTPTAGKDIKSLIGLNEKFQFTRELFNNDPALYSSALERLNAASDKATLHDILAQLSSERGWNAENKTVEAFKKVAERKF